MKTLTRSIPYWLLIVLSLASAVVGAWLVTDQIGTMTTTLLDGTATGIEVYVGQSWSIVGAVLLGAGVIGVLLALVLAAAKALVPAAAAVTVEPIDWTAESESATPRDDFSGDSAADDDELLGESAQVDDSPEATDRAAEDQKGSSGSIAIATNSSVK
jgi:UPF0716 family protein affecting phage T7 exclusion